jgi:hypothetical protein
VCQKPSQIEGHISANYEGWKGHHWEHPYGAARNLLQQEVGFHKEASGCVCVCVVGRGEDGHGLETHLQEFTQIQQTLSNPCHALVTMGTMGRV